MINIKNLFIIFVLLFSLSIASASFNYYGINVSGTITRPDLITHVSDASVMLLAKDTATNPEYCLIVSNETIDIGGTTYYISNQSNVTTDNNGYYSITLQGISYYDSGYSCNLDLYVNKTGYASNQTVREVIYDDVTPANVTEYEWNATLNLHANLTADITTDLINDPYSNIDQKYHITVNVTNIGDVPADSIIVKLSAINGSTITDDTVDIGSISGTSSETAVFDITSPSQPTTDTFTANVTGVDSDNSDSLNAIATKDIIIEWGAGGDDSLLNVTNVALNDTTIEFGTNETIQATATVLNDGNATANSTTTDYAIKSGNDCDDEDVSSDFIVIGPSPASYDLAGNTQTDFIYTVEAKSTAALGNYTICIDATATDGNSGEAVGSNTNYATFTVEDTIAPTITITSPAGGSVTGPSALWLLANTSEPVKECRFGNATSPTDVMTAINSTHYKIALPTLENGSYTYYVNCTDFGDNTNETSVTWDVDAIGPTIVLNTPANGSSITQGTWINLTITDPSNVNSAWYSVDGGANVTITNVSGSEYYIDASALPQGNISIVVWANDSFGNVNDSLSQFGQISFSVDNTGPTIVLTAPTNGSAINAGTLINFTITDPSGVDMAWYINGTENETMSNSGSLYIIDTTGWVEGNYTIIVWANDTLGNMNDSLSQFGSITFIVDDTAPNITVISPVTNNWYGAWIKLNTTATDNYGVKEVWYTWSNSTDNGTGMLTSNGINWLYTFPGTNLSEGAYNFTFTAYDYAANSATETVENVSIDHTGPVINITIPAALDVITTGNHFDVSANVSDALSGMINGSLCKVNISGTLSENITYNNVTGNCEGSVEMPHFASYGIKQLTVIAFDAVGNKGTSSPVKVNVTTKQGGGGGGGGGIGGGSNGTNETQPELFLTIDVEPKNIDMLSNETAEITVTLHNNGTTAIQSLYPDIIGFDTDEWSVEPPGRVDLKAGETATLTITITPKTHNSGEFTATISVGNSHVEKSQDVIFTITNVADIELAANARSTCDKAGVFIANLTANGADTTALSAELTSAEDAISNNDFRTALNTCAAILAATVPGINGTNAGNPGGITGFFIGIGDFVVGNWLWIAIVAATGLGLFVGRRQIASGISKLKGIKPPKMPSLPSVLPKKNEVKPAEKKDDTEWEIGF